MTIFSMCLTCLKYNGLLFFMCISKKLVTVLISIFSVLLFSLSHNAFAHLNMPTTIQQSHSTHHNSEQAHAQELNDHQDACCSATASCFFILPDYRTPLKVMAFSTTVHPTFYQALYTTYLSVDNPPPKSIG